MPVDPGAGKLPPAAMLLDVPRLMTAYYTRQPDPSNRAQRVAFGTSGHRGSALDTTYNEDHILAIAQAICDFRQSQQTTGPLFLGADTHALSASAWASALEVLAANDVAVMVDDRDGYTPTPVVSHAILAHNRARSSGFADGIVITPSHNPPADGGFKYNPPGGGGADTHVTAWIQERANALLAQGLAGVRRVPFGRARHATTTRVHDYMGAYVGDLGSVIDMDVLRGSGLTLGADPLGGAGVHYWAAIAEHHRVPITVVSDEVDATFRFVAVDWDGKIRMDPSSPYAMQRLVALRDRFDVAWACDTDHDRHGIVTPAGLLDTNRFLTAAIGYLFSHRPQWPARAGVGKTVVSSAMIDRVAARLQRPVVEVPVGFKWFVDGLLDGSLAFAGEESAGATLHRRDGTAWTTDKDGIVMGLLAAEMTAVTGRDPAELYAELTKDLGESHYARIDAAATPEQKAALQRLGAQHVTSSELAGDLITSIETVAAGNGAPIGGLKVSSPNAWFAARPSGTEHIYKLYAESFVDADHLRRVQEQAQAIVARALGVVAPR